MVFFCFQQKMYRIEFLNSSQKSVPRILFIFLFLEQNEQKRTKKKGGHFGGTRGPKGTICNIMSCRVSFGATHTAMPPLICALTLQYIGCPDVRMRHRLPR